MSDKQIQDWQEKVRSTYGEESKLYEYLFSTMDNFYYRYLETTQDKNLKTTFFSDHVWGAKSYEGSMVDALKISNPAAKKGIIELAKSFPKGKGALVEYQLFAEVKELSINHGEIHFSSVIHWGFPEFTDESKKSQKKVVFKYTDLTQFRKELALKLEDVCENFL